MAKTKPKRRLRWISRNSLVRLGLAALAAVALGAYMMWMPGKSYRGPLPGLSPRQQTLRDALHRDVEHLAGHIGERNVLRYEALTAAADFVQHAFETAGYEVESQDYRISNVTHSNLVGQITGVSQPQKIVVIGAHYDSVVGSPGADDNATGVAAILALARTFAARQTDRTLRFVAFVNEEPPYFQTSNMGSLLYARQCKQRSEDIVAMIAFDGLGCYSEEPNSQSYPPPFGLFYPSQGNFIGFLGNVSSRALVRRAIGTFRRHANFPSEGAAMPSALPGASWSDHWSFWQQGYPAIMVTDTLPFRYEHYHTHGDSTNKIDFDRMARVVAGMEHVIAELIGAD